MSQIPTVDDTSPASDMEVKLVYLTNGVLWSSWVHYTFSAFDPSKRKKDTVYIGWAPSGTSKNYNAFFDRAVKEQEAELYIPQISTSASTPPRTKRKIRLENEDIPTVETTNTKGSGKKSGSKGNNSTRRRNGTHTRKKIGSSVGRRPAV